LAVRGYGISPTDIFSYWSIDFAGPFPEDVGTCAKYAILAVDWLTRWAEGAASKDGSPETAAEFIYDNIVTRYGCPQCIMIKKKYIRTGYAQGNST